MHSVWLDALTMLLNDPLNIFLIKPNVIFYYFPFIKYIWISKILLVSMGLKLTEKKIHFLLILFFYIINCKVFGNII